MATRSKHYFNQHQAEKALCATFALLFNETFLIRTNLNLFLCPGQEEDVPATGVSGIMVAVALAGCIISVLFNDVNVPASKAVINFNIS